MISTIIGPCRQKAELVGKNIVVYDLEIKEIIGSTIEVKKDNLTEIKQIGWNNHDLMGISCGVMWDYFTMEFTVFMDDNMQELGRRLNSADLVVAFNHIGFDNKLLRANGIDLKPDTELKNYDMLVEGRKGIGWRENDKFPSGCKLDEFLLATFGQAFMKTASGEEAPKMWKNGEVGRLISYCLADVTREKALFEYLWENGVAFTQTNGVHRFAHPSTFFM